MSIVGLSHIGIAVPDLDAAISLFQSRLGVPPGPVLENPDQGVRLVQFDLGNAQLELLSPLSNKSPLTAFLAKHPQGGLHHLSLSADDLGETLAQLKADGCQIVSGPARNVLGRTFAFVHPREMCGVLTEVEAEDSDDR